MPRDYSTAAKAAWLLRFQPPGIQGLKPSMSKPKPPAPEKDPAAVSLGRKGGNARVKAQTPEQRSDSARKAAQARWAKHKESKT